MCLVNLVVPIGGSDSLTQLLESVAQDYGLNLSTLATGLTAGRRLSAELPAELAAAALLRHQAAVADGYPGGKKLAQKLRAAAAELDGQVPRGTESCPTCRALSERSPALYAYLTGGPNG